MSFATAWSTARGEKWLRYVEGMEAMLQPVDEPLILALRLDAPHQVADVGCGGGGTTLDVARRSPGGSVVVGYDISPALIESARRRVGSGEVSFELADVETAPPPAQPYGRVLSRFGTMFFRDERAAFANLRRWLAPSGRFAFAVWGPPAENAWDAVVRSTVAEIVDVPRPSKDEPGPFRYADVSVLLALLKEAGFGELDATEWSGTFSIGGGLAPNDAADFGLASFSSFAELLAQAGDAARESARERLAAKFSRFVDGGTVRLDARVHLVTGRA